ncbi:MAG: bifunctional folylpolyglutamate synthase/dihydrofolate synthase [Clostridiales bacterium]|nr:bifunctional folylpolyglutamate synthase/dihydrofolate synthase [Candidatus Blautia equi]
MNYRESRAYIEEANVYGRVLGLGNMHEMLDRLGHPEQDLKYIHVGGTNGKGSTIAYLYSVLQEAGYKVGRYVSPTLYSYRERLEVCGEEISREAFARCITTIAAVIDDMTAEGLPHPTPFEIETVAGFLYFKEEQCDIVLLEVGMGGDLDATNVISNTLLAVLVSISMDHEDFLGKTLADIAEKKAGIIKKGCTVVSTMQKPEVKAVFEKAAEKKEAEIVFADYKQAVPVKETLAGQSFSYQGEVYETPLAGVCQIENAVLALEALKALEKHGFFTTLEQRKTGIRKTVWNGRFTVIHENPTFIVDGAHNPGAADVLESSIRTYLNGKKIYYIMGMFKDKDYHYVIGKTIPYAEKVFAIETPDNPRALPAEDLAAAIREHGGTAVAVKDLHTAIDMAFAEAGEEDVILSFGSLSNIGAITEYLEERNG